MLNVIKFDNNELDSGERFKIFDNILIKMAEEKLITVEEIAQCTLPFFHFQLNDLVRICTTAAPGLKLDSYKAIPSPSPFKKLIEKKGIDAFAEAVVDGFLSIIEPFMRFKLTKRSTEDQDILFRIIRERFYDSIKETPLAGNIGRFIGVLSFTKL